MTPPVIAVSSTSSVKNDHTSVTDASNKPPLAHRTTPKCSRTHLGCEVAPGAGKGRKCAATLFSGKPYESSTASNASKHSTAKCWQLLCKPYGACADFVDMTFFSISGILYTRLVSLNSMRHHTV